MEASRFIPEKSAKCVFFGSERVYYSDDSFTLRYLRLYDETRR